MTETLTRPKPRIDHPEELERMVRQIVERVGPVAIYLFGSRARGDAHEASDYDLMIVVDDDVSDGQVGVHAGFRLIEDRKIPMDAIVVRRSTFAQRRHLVGTLSYKVAREGLLLHEQ